MNTKDFLRLIEGQTESPSLDFKANTPWDYKKLTKDILAMSNLPDGGHIIIGIEENGNKFINVGVDQNNINTYKFDEMRDQVSKYAEPMVDFNVYFPEDQNGLKYVVIKIFSFKEIPTLCKKTLDGEMRASTLYYRNTNKRPESAAISNVSDLRDVIELAAVRLMQRRKSFGYTIPNIHEEIFDAEIKAFQQTSSYKLIKSKGNCEVYITPLQKGNLNSLKRCLEVVEKAQVKASWTLPFIPRTIQEGSLITAENSYQAFSDLGARKEMWRMHLSENFCMINSFVEDWLEGDYLRGGWASKFPSGQYLFYYTTIIHYLTQLFVFIEHLTIEGLYKEGVRVSIIFNELKDRRLHLDAENHMPFINIRTTKANKITIDEEYTRLEILEGGVNISNSIILKVLDYFSFYPSKESVLQIQKQFLLKGH
ncbi:MULTISPECIES: AlbA family DNA-binding domain-containing protein [Weeksellaceae]|uniref:AlbA family DNA-binding domain-containing protein n=1 Tax=Weeksellaceae TaxID=2762318 RepID=UPI000679D077|nr:ATP-binding protein [Chryseobacterium sp. P1-3]ATL42241.1 ATP-binding protein [Elizabethkingia miricola]MDV3558019.1 ATP-binding protein [Elizabethkingia anophelis]